MSELSLSGITCFKQKGTSIGIRDPIHQWIEIQPHEKAILDSPLVQRLRRITQMGLNSFVFPGATNTRFMHSIGVMHLAGKYGELLLSNGLQVKCIKTLRIAGLLHDIGHGPFSHTWDKVVYSKIYSDTPKGHDQHRIQIVMNSPLTPVIQSAEIDPPDIVWMWTTEPFKSILQGPMGADRLDYMLRDAHFTGMQHFGTVAIDRIMHNASIVGNEVQFSAKVHDEIQRALEGREYLYSNVYEHHAVTKFESMLATLMEDAMKEGAPFIEYSKDLAKFDQLDETWFWGWFHFKASEPLRERAISLLRREKTW